MIEVCLDEEVRAETGHTALLLAKHPPAEPLLPFRPRTVRDGRDLTGELHAAMRGDAIVVEPPVPVRVGHQD